jgi:hypothetical protein
MIYLDRSVALAYLLAEDRYPSKSAGVEFIDENGDGPGVRLRKPISGKFGK